MKNGKNEKSPDYSGPLIIWADKIFFLFSSVTSPPHSVFIATIRQGVK